MRLIVSFVMALASAAAVGQSFPNRALRVIVPQPPGGGFDMVARTLSKSYALAGLRFGFLVAQPHQLRRSCAP